jgi:GGDEF domain-containing protein
VSSPELVTAPVVLIICVALLSTPLMRSDIQHRNDAVIDQLTGMLNRNALKVRVQELTQQSSVTGEPIGLIIGDLDHFKQINDTHGHSVGDAVLKEVAYLMRKQLRAFDLAYRVGGEEFLILLPGSDLATVPSNYRYWSKRNHLRVLWRKIPSAICPRWNRAECSGDRGCFGKLQAFAGPQFQRTDCILDRWNLRQRSGPRPAIDGPYLQCSLLDFLFIEPVA